MPRLQPLELEDAPAEAREFYALDEERYGYVLNNTKLYAYNVPVLRAMKAVVAGYAATSALPLSLKSLVRVRIALVNDCPFCADLHASIGLGDGLEEGKIAVLGSDAPGDRLSARERLAVEYADCVTITGRDVDDELFERLEAAFTAEEIIELTFTVAVENLFSKFHHALRVDAQGFCPVAIPRPEGSLAGGRA